MSEGWIWDQTLYAGSAPFYVTGRMPYPQQLAESLRGELALDGSDTALDVGGGPGSLTLLLAPYVDRIVGIDADRAMIEEAIKAGQRRQVSNVSWRHMRAEELPADLGPMSLVTFAQSFHWMKRIEVARAVRGMLTADGACVHVQATTHRGDSSQDPLPLPRPPYEQITELVRAYLGPVRRAGQSSLPAGTASDEAAIFREAGFDGPRHVEVPAAQIIVRSVDEVAAATLSLSSSTPHLFGARQATFEHDLRATLNAASADGQFCERTRDIAYDIWRPSPRFA